MKNNTPLDASSQNLKPSPFLSLLLLLVAYISFGWYLSDPLFPEFKFHGVMVSVPMICAIAWIWMICSALISPLSSFSRFISRWFKSDTVAFLSIFMAAMLATFVLFWLQLFLYILSIIATEALARVDVQTAGFTNWQAFVTLLLVSLMGLFLGWHARDYMPLVLQQIIPLIQSLFFAQ